MGTGPEHGGWESTEDTGRAAGPRSFPEPLSSAALPLSPWLL